MPAARGSLTKSNPVVDGKIYVIGGGNPTSARVDIYNPATDTWSRGTDMPTPRVHLATVAWNEKIYAFGGYPRVSSFPALNTTEVYNPKTDTWAEAAPMPRGVWEQSANVVDGRIYVVGGASSLNAERILQVYDPQTDMWTNATPMPLNTRGFGASVVCGKIYAVGGWFNSGQRPYSDTWVYDPTTDMWTETTSLPDFRAGLSTSEVNGRIYAIGGTPKSHNTQANSTVYELDLGFPPPDFNGDGVVDGVDMCMMIDHWHTDEPSYDIAPAPCGDGIVDVQDLVLLSEYLFEDVDDPTLIAHWALDEAEGDIAFDSAGINDAFVIGSPAWQPTSGQVNGAIELDGVDDFLVAYPVLNPADGPFSVLAWIKGGAPGQVILSQESGVNWLAADAVDGALKTDLRTPEENIRSPIPPGPPLISPTVVTDGDWHRVGFVRDGSHRILYVDDIEVACDTATNLESASGGLYIGAGSVLEPGAFWSGLIDDVRIYSRALAL